MLRNRIITALLLGPIILIAIVKLPLDLFVIFVGVIVALGAWEYAKISDLKNFYAKMAYIILILLLFALLHYFNTIIFLAAILGFCWTSFGILSYENSNHTLGIQYSVCRLILGAVALLGFGSAIIFIRQFLGSWAVIFIILLIWIMDIGSYFAGKKFGKHKLAPKVSPKKTVEGLIGGLIAVSIYIIILLACINLQFETKLFFAVMGLLVALSSLLGDLGVSLFKRISGVKDTGKLLPGHGGVLDRIDSILSGVLIFASLMFLSLG